MRAIEETTESGRFSAPISVMILATIILAMTVAVGVFWPATSLEVESLIWLRENSGTSLGDTLGLMDTIGDVGVMSVVLLVLAGLIGWFGRVRDGIATLAVGVVALLANIGLKVIIGRPRPDLWISEVDSTSSMPSGHTLLFTLVVFIASGLIPAGRWRWCFWVVGLVLVGAMGFSRLYLGEHYPTDIIASYTIAALLWAGYRVAVGRSQF